MERRFEKWAFNPHVHKGRVLRDLSKRRTQREKKAQSFCQYATSRVLVFQISLLIIFMQTALMTVNLPVRATSWSPQQEISSDSISQAQITPAIACDGDKVHVVWTDNSDGDADVYYRQFDGASWQPEQEISTDAFSEDQRLPAIAADAGKVHVVWMDEYDLDYDIYYRYFDGSIWQPEQEISSDSWMEDQYFPNIAAEGNEVHVTWSDWGDGDFDIYYRHFDGLTWEPEEEVSIDTGTENQEEPAIAVDAGRVHIVWQDWLDLEADIYYRYFDGSNWQAKVELSSDEGTEGQVHPSIDAEGGEVHVVWQDRGGGDDDIIHRYFNGAIWEPEEEVSRDIGTEDQFYPSLAANGSQLHVVWEDRREGAALDIYYRFFDGNTWFPEQELGWATGDGAQKWPKVAAKGKDVHVVWHDMEDGDYDIMYVRGVVDIASPTSNALPISPYWQISTSIDVEWTATDDLDLANVSLVYRHSADNSTWSMWTEFAFDDSISGPTATGAFLFTNPAGTGYYEFYTIARDISGNIETAPATADAIVALVSVPSPPRNPNAKLSGAGLEDVTVSWELSVDDGGGNNSLVRYDIYRGLAFDPSGSSYLLHSTVQAGESQWTDVLAGEGSPSNFFYRVCAVGEGDYTNCASTQVGKFTRSLSEGPNLVSIPLIQSNSSLENALQTVDWNKIWLYNTSRDEWTWQMKSKPYLGENIMLSLAEGFWLNAESDTNFTVAGIVPLTTSIHLRSGWNLIGCPTFNSTFTVGYLKSKTGATRVEGFDASSQPYFLRAMADADTLQAGFGVWTYVNSDSIATIGNQ